MRVFRPPRAELIRLPEWRVVESRQVMMRYDMLALATHKGSLSAERFLPGGGNAIGDAWALDDNLRSWLVTPGTEALRSTACGAKRQKDFLESHRRGTRGRLPPATVTGRSNGVAPSIWCVDSSVWYTWVFGGSTIRVSRIGAAGINETSLNTRPGLRIVAVSFLLKSPIG
jgi:hypothetical protein